MYTSGEMTPAKTTDVVAPPPERRIRYAFLDGMRGVAAAYVTLHHMFYYHAPTAVLPAFPAPVRAFDALFALGHFAVDMFIVLSGFSLMLGIAGKPGYALSGSFGIYLKRRARRILPPYYAATILSIFCCFLAGQWITWRGFPTASQTEILAGWARDRAPEILLAHAFLAHNLRFAWIYTINAPHWSVATEWQIYFLLPLWRRFGGVCTVGMALLLGWLPAFTPFGLDLFRACPWFLCLFAMGMITADWVVRANSGETDVELAGWGRKLRLALPICLLITAVGFYLVLHTVFDNPIVYYLRNMTKDIGCGSLVVCLILVLVMEQHKVAARESGRGALAHPLLSLLESPIARRLGDFSYSLYLTHVLLVVLWEALFEPHFVLSGWQWWFCRVFLLLPLIVGFAYLFHRVFERPFQQPVATGRV